MAKKNEYTEKTDVSNDWHRPIAKQDKNVKENKDNLEEKIVLRHKTKGHFIISDERYKKNIEVYRKEGWVKATIDEAREILQRNKI